MRIHDGVKAICKWENPDKNIGSHVVEMIKDGFNSAKVLGRSIMLLDRYFLSVHALQKLKELNSSNEGFLDI